jgi:peptidase M28-like protein/PDZ domain-containing protein/PA domain-containing protein
MAACAALLALAQLDTHAQDPASRIRTHVVALAADTEGRMTGSAGERRAADYIVAQLRRIGAQALPGQGDHRVPFQFTAGARDGGSSITVGGRTFAGRTDVQALSLSDSGTIAGPVVFAGYGIVLPDGQGAGYDSYASLDVKDKIVLVLRYVPEGADPQTKHLLARYSGLRYKALAARTRGAKALLVVSGPNSPNAGETIPMTPDTALSGSGIVAASIGVRVAEALLAPSGRALSDMQRALDSGKHVAGFDLRDTSVSLTASVVREQQTGHNILAYLPATQRSPALAQPWIVVGAHYDHLGHGQAGNSLAGKDEAGRVHHGADDNASGTAAVLAIAEALAREPRPRNIAFAFWSGEELGLLGSTAFVANPAFPMDQVAAYLNFDMVGRMRDNKLVVQATATSAAWPGILERANVAAGFDLVLQDDPHQPTDSASFNQANVATLNFFTGAHADYHRPTDTADKINYEDLERVAAFAASIVKRIAARDEPMKFVKVEPSAGQRASRAGVRIFTGTIPDYTTESKGLLLGGVVGGGPADRAGLQKGDVIVEIGGQTIANVYDYTYALDAMKVDQPVKVVYLRGGERRETMLTPLARK